MKKTAVSFADFNFSPELTQAIQGLGYETPTQIQVETIPLLMKGPTDFLGLASTGTGKTAAFAIPMLETMDASLKGVQALVLCPTRELAKQVTEQINLLARFKKTKAIAIYGGSDYGGQLRALKEGVSIVVGTPGRIIDHIERKTLNLDHLQTVILDEADEMISMGFREDIEMILETVNQEVKHQTWLFSATMSREVRKIADNFLNNPLQVQVNKEEGVPSSVQQLFYQVHEDQKPAVVEKLIDSVDGFYGLIFCQTKALVVELTQSLQAHGYPVDCLHGDMEQAARERTMKAFKSKQVTIVVCTDVASRGIDVKELTHVVNYSLPRELDLYIHRIGRTGRGGKEGIALALVNPSHMHLIPRIERMTRTRMKKAEVPTDEVLLKLKLARALTQFNQPIDNDLVKGLLLETGWKEVIDLMSKEEIAARFLAKQLKVTASPAKSVHAEKGFDQPRNRHQDRPKRDFGKGRYRDRPGFEDRGDRRPGRGDRFKKFDQPTVIPNGTSFLPIAPLAVAVRGVDDGGTNGYAKKKGKGGGKDGRADHKTGKPAYKAGGHKPLPHQRKKKPGRAAPWAR